ncbi:GNAT family N-acetyltransferase [Undibacterium pigrum]|uniref:Acetyltransferase (GNAT) family protein n=1 Tax=Undibacterium pigrum TaxID=401470 RepID=A0A318ILC1_9BURK|nr:GNAT family N-acetyltransferase [Undibacterium pigrum]PXX33946.1 acetyltransferase (GNAT) family protein [Undibacterium pigrum]
MSTHPDAQHQANQSPNYLEDTHEALLQADPELVGLWLKGWALARGIAQPVAAHGGWRVDVGWPEQKTRYVFPGLVPDIADLAHTIDEPWVFLKTCASAASLQAMLPAHWIIQRPGYMMTLAGRMPAVLDLPAGYKLDITTAESISTVRVLTTEAEVAASGRIVFVDELAIYDSIETQATHQRRGLGRVLMKQLEAVARERGIDGGVLVATPQGRALYAGLGWELHSLYSTAVIQAAT